MEPFMALCGNTYVLMFLSFINGYLLILLLLINRIKAKWFEKGYSMAKIT